MSPGRWTPPFAGGGPTPLGEAQVRATATLGEGLINGLYATTLVRSQLRREPISIEGIHRVAYPRTRARVVVAVRLRYAAR
jgi:hypothetical protein